MGESKNETITMQNLRKFCAEKGYKIFDKKAGSSTGMLFAIADGRYMCHVRFMDVLPGDQNDFVGFEIHPGIHARREFYPMTADYCEQVNLKYGAIQVDCKHSGEIFFKLELPIIENPVSCPTIGLVIAYGQAVLDAHAPTLDALAHGYIPPCGINPQREINCEKIPDTENFDLRKENNALYHYFVYESQCNIVSSSDGNWLCQICMNLVDEHYNLYADCTPDGMVRIRIGYGLQTLNVPEAYRRMTATCLARNNAKCKVGTVILDNGNVYTQTQLSLLDGSASKETLNGILLPLIEQLSELRNSIACISHGIIPESTEGEEKIGDAMLKRLNERMAHLRAESDDNDDNDDFGKDFKKFQSILRDYSEDDEEGEDEDKSRNGFLNFLRHLGNNEEPDNDENEDSDDEDPAAI